MTITEVVSLFPHFVSQCPKYNCFDLITTNYNFQVYITELQPLWPQNYNILRDTAFARSFSSSRTVSNSSMPGTTIRESYHSAVSEML